MHGGMVMPAPVVDDLGTRVVAVLIPEGLGPGDEFYLGGGKERPPVRQVTNKQAANAATAIQAASRGRHTRRRVSPSRAARRGAATQLQAQAREAAKTAAQAKAETAAAVAIQARYRGWQVRTMLSLPLRTVILRRPKQGGFGLSLTVDSHSCVVE